MSTVRLGDELAAQVRSVARTKGLTASEVHRRALAEYCRREMGQPAAGRFDDILGICDGPPDLAANVSAIYGAGLKGADAGRSA
jgi:hypothetical protein